MSAFLLFDGMTWPNPDDPNEVEWKLRYKDFSGNLSRGEECTAASFISAYRCLVNLPQKHRNAVCKRIREAAKAVERKR